MVVVLKLVGPGTGGHRKSIGTLLIGAWLAVPA
jgi:hypothetical protein